MKEEKRMRKQFFRRLPLHARWLAAILLLSLFALEAFVFFRLRSARNSSPLGTENDSLLQSHREDFSPDIEQNIAEQLNDPSRTIKAYLILSGTWFLSEKLSDFSQALTTEAIYAIPGEEQGGSPSHAYSLYMADENGVLEWKSSSSGSYLSGPFEARAVPCGFYRLTDEIIENELSEAEGICAPVQSSACQKQAAQFPFGIPGLPAFLSIFNFPATFSGAIPGLPQA